MIAFETICPDKLLLHSKCQVSRHRLGSLLNFTLCWCGWSSQPNWPWFHFSRFSKLVESLWHWWSSSGSVVKIAFEFRNMQTIQIIWGAFFGCIHSLNCLSLCKIDNAKLINFFSTRYFYRWYIRSVNRWFAHAWLKICCCCKNQTNCKKAENKNKKTKKQKRKQKARVNRTRNRTVNKI